MPKSKKPEPMHKMPGGMMMTDREMEKMMAEKKTPTKKPIKGK